MSESKDTQPLKINIAVENFGPIEKAEIDLRPLTVFVGESNTGKTYFATLIYALERAFEGFARVPLRHSIITLLKQSRYRSQKELDKETFETLTKLNTSGRTFKYSDFPKWLCTHIQNCLNDSEFIENKLKWCYDLYSVSELIRFAESKDNELIISLIVREEKQSLWNFELGGCGADYSVNGSVNENMILRSENAISQKELDLEDLLLLFLGNSNKMSDFYYLPAARSGIMETRGIIIDSLIERTTTGFDHSTNSFTFSGVIAEFLKILNNYKDKGYASREVFEIANLLEKEVLRGEIKVNQPNGVGSPQFLYKSQTSDQYIRISQASSMVAELAPLVLFLRGIVKPGDTLIIEEPESHLHPRAQTEIAMTIARLVRAGVRVIITTHSDWLLQQIGNLIREGELEKHDKETSELPHWLLKEEVGAWWFHTDKPVEEIPFDRIEGIEPRDYEDVADNLYNSFVDFERQFLNEKAESENE